MSLSETGQTSENTSRAEHSSTEIFALIWTSLAGILGTAATATLLRRATQRAMHRCPNLAELTIVRDKLEYRYTLPPAWTVQDRENGALLALQELAGELRPLLVEMTGQVVLLYLEKIPALREIGIVSAHRNHK